MIGRRHVARDHLGDKWKNVKAHQNKMIQNDPATASNSNTLESDPDKASSRAIIWETDEKKCEETWQNHPAISSYGI